MKNAFVFTPNQLTMLQLGKEISLPDGHTAFAALYYGKWRYYLSWEGQIGFAGSLDEVVDHLNAN